MNRLNKTEFAIFSSLMWSLLPKTLSNQNLLISIVAGVVPCGAVKRLPAYHHSADYIFWPLGLFCSFLVI